MATPVINYLAVLGAAVVSIVLGMLWYGPVFGKAWMKAAGISEKGAKKGMAKGFVGMVIVSLVFSYVLAHFVDYLDVTDFGGAWQLGFWVWLGFMATIQIGSYLWESRPFNLFLINAGYSLVQIVVLAWILAVWT
ncbi:DUF1761 domain-containing protein [Candidatus Woesearchaeota archaeon]|nr:DUF1761 domain-containing protein [Candidatus Woesearchaeota archaeon]